MTENVLYLGELPVWQGVQDQPGVREKLPFSLKVEKGLVRLNLRPEHHGAIVQRYSSPTYTFITTPPGASEWGSYLADGFFRELFRMVGDLEGKSVLEIGSGSLYLAERVVKELRVRRFVACDPALRIEASSGPITVVRDYFDYSVFKDHLFDLIMSINNLEHIVDPFRYLADIRRLLTCSGGQLFVIVPDCTGGLRTGDWGICVHEHSSYFTVSSFVATVTAIGFRIKELRTNEDKIIALLVPNPTSDETLVAHAEEDLLGKLRQRFFQNLSYAKDLFQSLKKRDARIGVHGCSVALNHVLSLLEMQTDPNIFLFDRDDAKVGKYLPAFHRKIMSTNDPAYNTMDDIVVGVTTFYDSIKSYVLEQAGFTAEHIFPLVPLV